MSAFLIDEMFALATAVLLRDTYGHDALHVAETGLRASKARAIRARYGWAPRPRVPRRTGMVTEG
jgi:hypothetical protein